VIDLQKQLDNSRKLIAESPQPHDCYNHAMLCAEIGEWDEATAVLDQAHKMMPECPVIARYLSIGLLKQGNFTKGLELFERRFEHPIPEGPPCPFGYTVGPRLRERYDKPYWDGIKNIKNKTIFVFNEGGHGDLIQNVRYLPKLKALCDKVILEVKNETLRIMQGVEGVDEVIPCGSFSQLLFFNRKQNLDKINKADYVVSLHSLMRYFDPDLVNIPWNFPYLSPISDNKELAEVVCNHPAKKKIGIVWAGKPGHGNDNRRSTFMKSFLPLKNIPKVQLFSLQKGEMKRSWDDREVDLLAGGEILESIDLGPMLNDFADTAMVLKELDALVCVDTSIGHLAGALNTPVWTLLPTKCWAEWRWQRKWYESQRVCFQTEDGNWQELVERVALELANIGNL